LTGEPLTEDHSRPALYVGDDEKSDQARQHNNTDGLAWRSLLSYGRLSEYEMDPEAQAVNVAIRESRHESLFMLLGFTLFAVVPSLAYLVAPLTDDTKSATQLAMSPTSLVVSLTATIMWFLGVWKSRFLDCNWVLFGIETVVLLMVCILSAYGVGALLSQLLPTYLLKVAISSTTSEHEL
jgi:hypothetical protein